MVHPFFLRVAYVGTRFHGWQIQTLCRSVQAELWQALHAIEPTAPMPQGTGRTDAGVHARAQGVLLQLARPWDPYRLMAALNAHLPEDVRVMAAQPAPAGFWPRQHAIAKRYVYRLAEGPAADPFERAVRWHVHGATPLDRRAMAQAAEAFLGTHDFASFRHKECVAPTTHRTVHRLALVEDGARFDLIYEGDRFLMHQVRIMTGTLVDVGKGRMAANDLAAVLGARDRAKAGRTAPPHGLCLEEVWYQPRWGVGAPCPWPDMKEGGASDAAQVR